MTGMLTKSQLLFLGNFLFAVILSSLFFPKDCLALTPIARWDVVPYQRIEYGSSLNIGVVAFSKPGIKKVEFTATGQGYSGGTKTSTSMSLNSTTGTWEYWVSFPASDFSSNGAITITATVTDNNANTRNLALPMLVYGASAFSPVTCWVHPVSGSDSTCAVNNESAPCKTIGGAAAKINAANGGNSDGAIIYLQEGTYSLASTSISTSGQWVKITKDKDANRDNVILQKGSGAISGGYIHFDSVTLKSTGAFAYVSTPTRLWTHNCRKIGSGRWIAGSNPIAFSDSNNHYSTNDYTYNVDFAYYQAALVRGATIEIIGNDVFQNTSMVVNCTANDMSNGTTGLHADGYQSHTSGVPTPSNRIIYNYKLTDASYQGVFLRADAGLATDNAFVNVLIEMQEPPDLNESGAYTFTGFSLYQAWDHLLLWNCSFIGGHEEFSQSALTNSSFVGNYFYQYISQASSVGISTVQYAVNGNSYGNEFLYNHFEGVYGETSTCIKNTVYSSRNWPCPQWYAKKPDSGSPVTATIGDNVIDTTDPLSSNFGAPLPGSVLLDRMPFVKVPVDIYGNPRTGNSDVGAVEFSTGETPPATLTTPAGFQLNL
ncbi:MAG: hypothetical protein ACYDBT_10180 [Desulfobulbaceae bacterium]